MFKNIILNKDYRELLKEIVGVNRGVVGGFSLEVETENPQSFSSYLYLGKNGETDLAHDFELLNKMLDDLKKPPK